MWRKKHGGGQTRYKMLRQQRKKLSRNGNYPKKIKIKKCTRPERKSARKLWLLQKTKPMQNYTKSWTVLKETRYKLSKTRNRRTKDICDNIFINDKEGKIQTDTPKITDRWQEYFTELLNETNPRKELEECEETYGPISNITLEEVRTQLKRMKTGKACGPDQIPIEVWTLLGDEGLEYLLQTMNAVIDEGMPLSWRKSEISPLFKGKGSVLECGNYN